MSPLISAFNLPGESPDPTFSSSKLTGGHQDHPLQLVRPDPVNTLIRLPYLPIPFIFVPLLPVLGQRILTPLCWPAPLISVCASLTGYFLTYLATALGLVILSPLWLIHITHAHGIAWYATKLASGPIGSLLLRWLMGNDYNPRLLGPVWILLAMSVGQGTASAFSSVSQVLLEDVQRVYDGTGYEEGLLRVGWHEEFSDNDW